MKWTDEGQWDIWMFSLSAPVVYTILYTHFFISYIPPLSLTQTLTVFHDFVYRIHGYLMAGISYLKQLKLLGNTLLKFEYLVVQSKHLKHLESRLAVGVPSLPYFMNGQMLTYSSTYIAERDIKGKDLRHCDHCFRLKFNFRYSSPIHQLYGRQ